MKTYNNIHECQYMYFLLENKTYKKTAFFSFYSTLQLPACNCLLILYTFPVPVIKCVHKYSCLNMYVPLGSFQDIMYCLQH